MFSHPHKTVLGSSHLFHHSKMPPACRKRYYRLGSYRVERYIQSGIRLVDAGYSFRKAAEEVHLSPSTLHYHYHRQTGETPQRTESRTTLSAKEEDEVVQLLLHYARRGRPISRTDLMDVVEAMVMTFPPWRQDAIRFRDGRPGRRFCELFEARHSDRITFRKPSRQNSKRYHATNAKVLVAHMTTIRALIETHKIPPGNILNVDETGFSPVTDTKYGNQRKVIAEKSVTPHVTNPHFENVNRITVLSSVYADGTQGRAMFVYQGTRIRTRRITRNGGSEVSQCISEVLPAGSLVTARKDIASVDKSNFLKWAEQLVIDTEPKRKDGDKILLIYDGYRSHLDIPILELMANHDIIAYALPAHTSGTTQPLVVGVFPSFKYHYRSLLEKVYRSSRRARKPLDEFDVSQVISRAYHTRITRKNIAAAFAKTGLYPFDDCRLFAQARQYSFEEPHTFASIDEMVAMMNEEKKKTIADIVENVQVHSSGFLDTTYGAVLTSDAALGLLRLHVGRKERARNVRVSKLAEEERALAEEKNKKSSMRLEFERSAASRRVSLCGEAFNLPRPLPVRRAIAKSNASRHRVEGGEDM